MEELTRFTLRVPKDLLEKFSIIASVHERSRTKEIQYLMKQHVQAYEEEHGEIHLER